MKLEGPMPSSGHIIAAVMPHVLVRGRNRAGVAKKRKYALSINDAVGRLGDSRSSQDGWKDILHAGELMRSIHRHTQ